MYGSRGVTSGVVAGWLLSAVMWAGCAGPDELCEPRTPPAAMTPAVQCEWSGPPAGDPWPDHGAVLSTPVVVDLRFDPVPYPPRPSIAFVSYLADPTNACLADATRFGVLRVIDGHTCEQQLSIASPLLVGTVSLAAGDLRRGDGGRPELVAAALGGHPVAFGYDPDARQLVPLWEATTTSTACSWTGPTIVDVDHDGAPEVLLDGAVFDGATGALRAAAPAVPVGIRGDYDVFVRLPAGDRLVTGIGTFAWQPPGWTADASFAAYGAGATAVADLGAYGDEGAAGARETRDGAAEIVWVRGGVVRIFSPTGVSLLDAAPPGLTMGGPPAVADLDGDGRAEIAVGGYAALAVVDPDCEGAVTPACPSGGAGHVAWTTAILDHSSAVSGASAFDFENDGRAEVVFGDECHVRILDGATGAVRFQMGRRSLTYEDLPVVADTDGDGRAEVVVISDGNTVVACPEDSPPRTGVTVLGDDGWVRARPRWNQQAYTNRGVAWPHRIPADPDPEFALDGPNGFRLMDACGP